MAIVIGGGGGVDIYDARTVTTTKTTATSGKVGVSIGKYSSKRAISKKANIAVKANIDIGPVVEFYDPELAAFLSSEV